MKFLFYMGNFESTEWQNLAKLTILIPGKVCKQIVFPFFGFLNEEDPEKRFWRFFTEPEVVRFDSTKCSVHFSYHPGRSSTRLLHARAVS